MQGWRSSFSRRAVPAMALAVLALGAASGCGPSVRVEPLIGEESELLEHVATTVPDLTDHAPARAVRALHDALVRDDMGAAWDLLTDETHAALDEAARVVAAPSGRTLFEGAADAGVPLLREGQAPTRVTPLRWLLVEDVAWYRRSLDPEAPPDDTATEATIYVIDSDNRYREVRLRKVGDRWLVHQPTVRYGDLVADI